MPPVAARPTAVLQAARFDPTELSLSGENLAGQVQPRSGHQCGQPLHELQRRHHQASGAVAPGSLQIQHHLVRGVALHALVGQRRTGDVAAKLFRRLAVISVTSDCGVQAESVDVGAQVLPEAHLPGLCALQRQHLLAGARTEGAAADTSGHLQPPERAGFVRVGVVVCQAGRALLFGGIGITSRGESRGPRHSGLLTKVAPGLTFDARTWRGASVSRPMVYLENSSR